MKTVKRRYIAKLLSKRSFLVTGMSALSALLLGCNAPIENTEEAFDSISTTELSLTGAGGSNWMASINSDLALSQLSIPGSHETMALYESMPGTAKCQDMALRDQLDVGVRFLDIRCRHVRNEFKIYHGSVYQNANFDDVLNAVTSFLNSNPSEAIILSVKEEYTPTGNKRSFEETFDWYVSKNPGQWNLGSNIPTLAQSRRLITLFRRFSANRTPKGIDASVWPDNTTFAMENLRVQDNYVVNDNNWKWEQISNTFSEAWWGSPTTLFLNFTSGYKPGSFGVPNIPTVSNYINPRIVDYFSTYVSGRYGIVPMDFVDSNRTTLIFGKN